MEVTEQALKSALRILEEYGGNVAVVRGRIYSAEINDNRVSIKEFLGYSGISSSFALKYGGGEIEVCTLKVSEEPVVTWGKVRNAGEVELSNCVKLSELSNKP